MIKDAYDMFFKKISLEFSDDPLVLSLAEDAEELAKYGERRVALENFLENILENGVKISNEMIALAEKAFSDAPSDYDLELIKEISMDEWEKLCSIVDNECDDENVLL